MAAEDFAAVLDASLVVLRRNLLEVTSKLEMMILIDIVYMQMISLNIYMNYLIYY